MVENCFLKLSNFRILFWCISVELVENKIEYMFELWIIVKQKYSILSLKFNQIIYLINVEIKNYWFYVLSLNMLTQ